MMAAEVSHGETHILAESRQVTRLGESVFRSGRVSKEALDFLCANLARMSATYSQLNVVGVRAVATSAVRDANNQRQFLQRTSAALGTNVEIISGPEEARLIRLGVEARWPRPKEQTLIIDVGGGSAELIITQSGELIDAVSKPLGALRLTEVFLRTDPPNPDELRRLDTYIEEKIFSFHKQHSRKKLDRVVATSATAAAIVSALNRVPRAKRDAADRFAPRRLRSATFTPFWCGVTWRAAENKGYRSKARGNHHRRNRCLSSNAGDVSASVPLLLRSRRSRRNYRGSGRARSWARTSRLSREQRSVVDAMVKRYGIAANHARQVAYIAHRLFEILQPLHRLPSGAGKLLEAAAYLHDIGHFVSGNGHHNTLPI